MYRHAVFALILLLLIPTLLFGCVALGVVYPTECEADLPITNYKHTKSSAIETYEDAEFWGLSEYGLTINLPDKDVFIREWGLPDQIISVSTDKEILVYNHKMWCGVGAIWVFIPAPLFLPVCKGFDQITFTNNKATHIHFKKINGTGFFIGYPIGWKGGTKNQCPPSK